MTRQHTTIGIELEYIGSAQAPLDNIRQLGRSENKSSVSRIVDERSRYHTTFFDDRWVMGCDSTVDYEIKSHPLRDTEEIRTVMAGIKLGGGRVTSDCGTHIHVGIGTFGTKQLARLGMAWLRYEKALDELQPRSRRASASGWCTSVYQQTEGNHLDFGDSLTGHFRTLKLASTGAEVRYYLQNRRESKLNLYKFESVGTVEFRGHSGTLNFPKIDAWISCLTAICKIAMGKKRIKPQVATFDEMLAELVPIAANATKRPAANTVTGGVWAECDRLYGTFENVEGNMVRRCLLADGEAFPNVRGRRVVSNIAALAGLVHINTGIRLGTCKTQVQRWAASTGHAKRATLNPAALTSYLTGRRDRLAGRNGQEQYN